MREIKELWGIAVPYALTEKLRRLLNEQKLINSHFNFKHEKDYVIIPLTSTDKEELLALIERVPYRDQIKLIKTKFQQKKRKISNLTDYLKQILPHSLHPFIPKSFDVIGDIVVIEIKEELQQYKEKIGKALTSLFPSISTVYQKCSAVSGELRIRELELIAGVRKCETTHIEHGIRLFVNVCQTYFSPRLGDEHTRVAALCQHGDVIVDLFTGVGPFPMHIAKNKKAKIYAIDINPVAIECLKKSIKLNRIVGEIIPICDDVRNVTNMISEADRVIMNLPGHSHNFIDVLCMISKPGTIVHFYHFVPDRNPEEQIIKLFQEALEEHGWKLERVLKFQKVRESAPHELHVRLDAMIKPIRQ